MLNLKFEYAIKFQNGLYYTGNVNSNEKPNNWQGEKHQAYTYSEIGAYRKIDGLSCFNNCTVERVL